MEPPEVGCSETSEEILWLLSKKNQDLFDENDQEIQELLAKR